jgi:prepilin-type N-terminal cleavage/methylation domain-containing protein
MTTGTSHSGCAGTIMKDEEGFTLIELLISMVVATIVLAAVYTVHSTQSKSYSTQREVSKVQQNVRAAMHVLAWDIRNAQRDPEPRQRYRFRTQDTGLYLASPADTSNVAGLAGISFSSLRLDTDRNGVADTVQTVSYRVRQPEGALRPGLYRRVDPVDFGAPAGLSDVWQLVAEGIEAIDFAYAFDADGDGRLELSGGNIIWAVDSSNSRRLDASLNVADGTLSALAAPVSYDCIRLIRIFLLGISERPSPENFISREVIVGRQIIQPDPEDKRLRRLVTMDVSLRNYLQQ